MISGKMPAAPLKAVFFLDQLPQLAPMLGAWTQAGNQVAAVVMMRRHNARLDWWLDRMRGIIAPQWSLPAAHARHAPRAPVIRLPRRIDWDGLEARMAALDADVLISAYFPRRIPENLLSAFRCGGVNMHPALLPCYRGPAPIHNMLLDDAWREHGGVTLHRMSAGLDEGEIIATARLPEEHWRDGGTLNLALGGAMASLVAHAIPAFCRGEAVSIPQPASEFPWAGSDRIMTVDHDWQVERLERLLTFFGRTPGVYLSKGESLIKLGSILTVIGPPSEEPPLRRGQSVEFDVVDARVSCRRPPWLRRRSARMRTLLEMRRHLPPDIAFQFADALPPSMPSD